MRPSIESALIASPAYSMTWPLPPAVPISPMMARMMSLAVTPSGSLPSTRTSMFLALDWISVWVASTCSTSDRADAVRQRAERAMRRGMAVAADDGGAGQREALLGPDHMHDALAAVALVIILDAEIAWRSRRAWRSGARTRDRRCLWSGRWSARCGRPRPASSPARAPCARPCAGPRRPAGSSPHAPDAGRHRAGRCRRAPHAPDGRPRSCRRGCGAWSWQSSRFGFLGRDSVSAAGLQTPKRRPCHRPALTGRSSDHCQ